ncbi:hypothetical protein BBP40_004165 [Aspergillus hancockii]|nr:hypothetical protein BBP40_004165 [Aspergillus hancockii]
MPAPPHTIESGPYGGNGGSYYDATHGTHRITKIDAWGRSYRGYDVLNGFRFTFDDNQKSPLVGHENPNIHRAFEFEKGEKITSMTIHAGDNEGFVNGFEFDTNKPRHYEVGGKEGLASHITGKHLGNGEWAGAQGRDRIHGASEVVDNMDIFFKT